MKRFWMLLALAMVALAAQAQELQPLILASLPTFEKTYQGERHALIFWSLTCVPCHEELKELARLDTAHRLPVVLINTDDVSQAQDVRALLAQYRLQGFVNWQFADAMPERLRHAIDPDWYGELPRSYAVDSNGRRLAHSGKADMTALVSWLTAQESAVRNPPANP